ncbi:unnamed protein product [Closterium sp. Naga37s-1]|nr:unnamed protein product [Closterium sp. Naga37s-1]
MAVVLFLIVFGAVLLGLALSFQCDDVVIRVDSLDFHNMSFSQQPAMSGSGDKMLLLSAQLNVSANVFNPNENTMVVEQLFVAIDGMDHPMTNVTLPGFTLAPRGNLTQTINFVVSGYPLFTIAANESLLRLSDKTKNLPFKMVVKSLGHVIYHGFNTPSYYAGNLSRHVSVTAPAIEPAGPSDADFAPKSMDERFQSILAKRNRQVRATEAAVRQTAARQARIASQRQITVEDVHAVANMAPDFPPRFTAHVSVAGAAGSHQPTDPFLDDSFVGYRGRTSESAEDEEEEMEDATIDDYKKSDSRGVTKGKHATLAPGGSSNPTRHTFDPTGRRSANHSIPLAKTPSASAAKAAAAAALAGSRVKKNSQAVTDQITDRGRDSGRHKSTQSSPPPHSRSADRSRRSPKPTASLAGGLMTAFHPSLTSPFVAAPTGPLLPNPVLFRTIPVSVGGLVGGLVSPDPRYREEEVGRWGGEGCPEREGKWEEGGPCVPMST